MSQSNYLILFTLGPVQSFIAQARKTQDLYAGSKLLSYLIKVAINKVGENHLIFPAMGAAMPNRFLAYVPDSISDFQKFGEGVEKTVRTKWKEISESTLKGIASKPTGFDEQINSHLEIFWVIEEVKDSYAATLKSMERQLAAIKNVRPFYQLNYSGIPGEKGRKCSLDGQRNALFFGKDTNQIYLSKKWNPDAIPLNDQPKILIGKNEGLSAVSFTKRFWQDKSFPATAEIALMYDIAMMKEDFKTCLKEYKNNVFRINDFISYCLKNRESRFSLSQNDEFNKHFDYQYLYKENITEQTFPYQAQRDLAEQYIKVLGKHLKQKYYAILTFDGDDMGKWLAGSWLADGSDLEDFHIKFADQLAVFAKKAKEEVDKVGKTVYAGGDDFLGFVNLYHLLPVLKKLRGLFREMVNDKLSYYRKDKEISFTAGICIAHYKEPLSLVLDSARDAQKTAKDLDGKNAFGITVIKGSGESHTAVAPFGGRKENVEKLDNLIKQLIAGNFSNTFLKSIQLEFERVEVGDQKITYDNMFRSELTRLLKRSAKSQWDKEIKKVKSMEMCEDLMNLKHGKPSEFFQLLNISDFMHRTLDASIIES